MQDIKELVFIALTAVLAIAGVQWLLLRFTHWSVTFIVTVLAGLFISGLYVSLKHARPNGGSSGPPSSEYFFPQIIVITCLLLGMWLVSFLSKIQVPKLAFIIPLCFILVFTLGRHIYQYIYSVTHYNRLFSNCKIELVDSTGGKSNLREIYFQNTSSSLVSSVEINSVVGLYPRLVRDASRISFHSYTEKKGMIRQAFPFDYSLCKEKDGKTAGLCFWVTEKDVLPIKIIVLANDKVNLHIDGELVNQYQLKDE